MSEKDNHGGGFGLGGLSVGQFVKRLVKEVQEDELTSHAAALAYYFIFAVFPFFLFLAALLGFLPIPDLTSRILSMLDAALPEDAMSLIGDNVREVVRNQSGGLLSFGILGALWTSSTAIVGITNTLNHAYDIEESRPFWKVRGLAMLLTVVFSVFVITSTILLMFGPQIGSAIADKVGLGTVFETTWNILRWPVIVALVTVAIQILYYACPDVEQRWRWVTLGALVAVIVWIAVSLGFSIYVDNFGSYNKTYGSIGSIIVLLLWLYISGFVLLLGGEINAISEHAAAEGKEPGTKTPSD